MTAVIEQLAEQVGVTEACEALDMPRSRVYRARQPKREPQPLSDAIISTEFTSFTVERNHV